MALSTTQQIITLLKDKRHILITFAKNAKGDAIGGALGLQEFLEKMGKQVEIVSDDFVLPPSYSFLKKSNKISSTFSHLRKCVITINLEELGLENVSYDMQKENLRLYITPKQGAITKERIKITQSTYKYDLIICLDTPDLESLGRLYIDQADLFHKTPIINIDHKMTNEHFGQINLIDLTSAATSEVIYNLLDHVAPERISENIATSLLTGMISKTRSFKSSHTKPHTLKSASKLMKLGGDRDEIIKHLYHNRSVTTLKLWGQALANLEHIPPLGIVTTKITREDFARTGATIHDVEGIIDELLSNSPEAKIILLLHENTDKNQDGQINIIVKSTNGIHAKKLLSPFAPEGSSEIATGKSYGMSLRQVEEKIIEHIQKILKQI